MQSPAMVVSEWQAAWNAGDASRLSQLFAEDADFVNVVGLWWHDRDSIREAHHFGFTKIFPGSVIEMGEPRVRQLGPDAAVVQSKWSLAGQVSPEGEQAGAREGIFTFVVERRREGWIAVTAHNTDIVPGTQTHVYREGERSTVHYREKRSISDSSPSQQ